MISLVRYQNWHFGIVQPRSQGLSLPRGREGTLGMRLIMVFDAILTGGLEVRNYSVCIDAGTAFRDRVEGTAITGSSQYYLKQVLMWNVKNRLTIHPIKLRQ